MGVTQVAKLVTRHRANRTLPKKQKHQPQHQDKHHVHQPIGENVLAVALIKLAKAAHGRG